MFTLSWKWKGLMETYILRWREFWDTFEYSIHNNQTLQKVDKWNYLKSQLTGKAADSGLDRTNQN